MSLFEKDSYKEILKSQLNYKKINVSSAFTYEKMAHHCGIQKTYLSRVLNSNESHLSEEQLELASHYLGLGKPEREFLQLLRRRERVSEKEIKKEWTADIDAIRRKNLQTDQYLDVKQEASSLQDWTGYYLNPTVMLVHVFLTIPKYRKNVGHLKKILQISEDQLHGALRELETLNLINMTEQGYQILKSETHLSSDSPLYRPFRNLQRLKAIEKIDKLSEDKAYSFSVAFSANEKVKNEIQRRILKLISEVEKLVASAPEEEVFQLNIDLFDWF